MNAVAKVACALAFSTMAYAQNGAKQIHLEGEQARTLISLVANGNDKINQRLKEGHATGFKLAEVSAMKWSTFKYDSNDPYFRLDIYSGSIKLPGADSYLPLTDGRSMYEFLDKLGMPGGVSAGGDDIDAANVNCAIHAEIAFGNAKRFTCDLEKPF